MAKIQPKRTDSYLGGTVIRNAFGIQSKTLADRKVKSINRDDEPLAYCLYDVIKNCSDLILKKIEGEKDIDGVSDIDILKTEKIREEIRKLRIDNDVQEGGLVNAIDVEIEITNGYRAIADSLDSITTQFYMNNPDITTAQLASLESILTDARNKIAEKGV